MYGEYRKNKIQTPKQLKEIQCKICNTMHTQTGLAFHLKTTHGISKYDYIIQYILNNNIPMCKCGCGKLVNVHTYFPYIIREYLSGHNSRGERNPNYGKTPKLTTLQKMRDRAVDRIANSKTVGEGLPMHQIDAIDKRAQAQTDKFVKRMQEQYNVIILKKERYDDNSMYSEVLCNTCNHQFAQYHQSYFMCPRCFPRNRSVYEFEIETFLRELVDSDNILLNTRSILSSGKELDFVIPSKKLAIEFNGIYWHSELQGKNRKYHAQKTEEAESIGYTLLQIFEDEWIANKEIIKNKIRRLLGKQSTTKIYARKCIIKEVKYKQTRDFLNTHHLQGADSCKHRYGLYYNDELISVMTFSKPNASRGPGYSKNINDEYELSRFCTHTDYVCVGGASKLLNYFIHTIFPKKIYSYADRRYSSIHTNVYQSLGFTFASKTAPSYWYFTYKDITRKHRFNFTKKRTIELGGDPNKTEWENMVNLGYDRIWDCGHLKYILEIK